MKRAPREIHSPSRKSRDTGATQTVSKERPLKQFIAGKSKSAGRNSKGRITIFHRGGGTKRSQRIIDLKRNTSSVGIMEIIEYGPNRTSRIFVVRWKRSKMLTERTILTSQNELFHLVLTSPTMPMKGQFNFSSLPGMTKNRKVVSSRPKTGHLVVGLRNGVSPYSSKATNEGTKPTNVRDVFLSAFSSSDPWEHRGRFAFVSEFGVPRMALAGSRLDFFVSRYKDVVLDTKRLAFDDEVKNWRKDSVVWDHKMKRTSAVSWQSVRRQKIGLGFAGVCGDKDSKLKAMYKAIGKEHLNGKFTAERAPVTYILATNQMKAGQMVMNIDSSKRSKEELLNRYRC
ncbi:ribosomal protein L2 [Tanacetum coccineum]